MGKDERKGFQFELATYLADQDFVYGPEPELYTPMAGFYSYGLLGKALKNKVEDKIREVFVGHGFFEMEFPLISSEIVWKASGHLDGFSDPVISCSKCKSSFRADKLVEEETGKEISGAKDKDLLAAIKKNGIKCPNCKGRLEWEIIRHSLMMKTIVGRDTVAYNRPETATTTYLPFKRYVQFFRGKLPFTVFQIGKAFRNEVSPRQHLLRMREFTQAEAQIFIGREQKQSFPPFKEVENEFLPLWSEHLQKEGKTPERVSLKSALKKNFLRNEAYSWALLLAYKVFLAMGIPKEKMRFRQHHSNERAFYADDAWDLEIELNSFGWTECCGVHDRTTYDLSQHAKFSKQKLVVRAEDGKETVPDVIEIAFGVDRPFYALLDLAFFKRKGDEKRTVLSLPPSMAPIDVGVFPLIKKDGLPEKAREVLEELKGSGIRTYYDDAGSIGKRYSRLDAGGVPFCVTIDHNTLKDDSVTIRERDSLKQTRVKIRELRATLEKFLSEGFAEK